MQGRLNYTLRPRILCLDTATLMVYGILIFYVFLDWKNFVVHNILAEMQDKNSLPDEVAYNFPIYWFPHWKDFPSSLYCLSAIMSRKHRPVTAARETWCLCGVSELRGGWIRSVTIYKKDWMVSCPVQNFSDDRNMLWCRADCRGKSHIFFSAEEKFDGGHCFCQEFWVDIEDISKGKMSR